MNVEYIGYDDAVLDANFASPSKLVGLFNGMLKEEGFTSEFGVPSYYQGTRFFRDFNLDSNGDYKVGLHSVHENGIVIEFKCIIDAGSAKYNTATSALLIVKDGEIPKFVISGIDGRVNKDVENPNNSFWVNVNQELIQELISGLGKRVDEAALAKDTKDNVLVKKLKERKVELAMVHINNRVEHVAHILDALEENIEYRRGK